MDITSKIQVYIFATSLYGGLIAGLFYDIYRINRYYFKPKNIATIVEDFIFWIGIALIFFYILNKSNWIELRAYVFIGFFVGGIIYLKILSKIFFPFLIKLLDKITAIIKEMTNFIVLPFKYINKKIGPKIRKLKRSKGIFKEAISEIKRYTSIIFRKK